MAADPVFVDPLSQPVLPFTVIPKRDPPLQLADRHAVVDNVLNTNKTKLKHYEDDLKRIKLSDKTKMMRYKITYKISNLKEKRNSIILCQ